MVEARAEGAEAGEGLEVGGGRVGVADGADGALRVGELLRVAAGARRVAGASGARAGVLVASQVSPGNYNRLSLKIYGDKAGLEWYGHEPEYLRFCEFGKPHVIFVPAAAPRSAARPRGPRACPQSIRRVTSKVSATSTVTPLP